MLKCFYNIMLVSVLSGSLLLMDFHFKSLTLNIGFNSAQAETLKTEGIQDSDLMATLVMTSVSLLVSRLYKCKLTSDMMIAAAGGVAFFAGEVVTTLKLSKVMKDMEIEIERTDTGRVEEKQIEALEILRKSYEEAIETAKIKKILQLASAASFALAGLTAGVLYMQETAAETACVSSLATVANTCAAQCATFAASPEPATKVLAPPYCAGGTLAATQSASEKVKAAANQVPAPSGAQDTQDKATTVTVETAEQTAAAQCPNLSVPGGICTSAHKLSVFTKGVCLVPPVASIPAAFKKQLYANDNFTSKKQASGIYNLLQTIFLPEAHAAMFSIIGIASSLAISFILETSATLGIQLDTMLFSPLNRGIIWGVLAGLVFVASTAIDNQIKKLNENIKKIDEILNSMNELSKGMLQAYTPASNNLIDGATTTVNSNAAKGNGTNTPVNDTKPSDPNSPKDKTNDLIVRNPNTPNLLIGNNTPIDLKGSGVSNLPCITNNCESISTAFTASTNKMQMPDSLQIPTDNALALGDGLSGQGKISGATLGQAALLANRAMSLRNDLKKQQKDLQKKLKASGSKINLAKDGSNFEDGMKAAVQKALDDKKMSASGMYGQMGGDLGKIKDLPKNGDATINANENEKNKGLVGGSIDLQATKSVDSNANRELPWENKSLMADGKEETMLNKGKGGSIDDYKIKNDITLDKGSSLWAIISNRYRKSGYARLFKKIDQPEKSAEKPKEKPAEKFKEKPLEKQK